MKMTISEINDMLIERADCVQITVDPDGIVQLWENGNLSDVDLQMIRKA